MHKLFGTPCAVLSLRFIGLETFANLSEHLHDCRQAFCEVG